MRNRLFPLLAASAMLAATFAARADDQANSPAARLKEVLKNTLMQLRTVTADRDALQAQVDDLKSQTADLNDKLTALMKKSATAQDAASKTIAVLKGQISDQEESIAKLQQSLDQWKASQAKAVEIANQTEAKRAKLADLSIHLQRIVDDQRVKNAQMYKVGMEILDRYEKFGLGEGVDRKRTFCRHHPHQIRNPCSRLRRSIDRRNDHSQENREDPIKLTCHAQSPPSPPCYFFLAPLIGPCSRGC